jgi:hypothetical protein
MPVIVIAIAGTASYFRGRSFHQRNYGMVRKPTAFYAKVVNDVSEPQITHQCK